MVLFHGRGSAATTKCFVLISTSVAIFMPGTVHSKPRKQIKSKYKITQREGLAFVNRRQAIINHYCACSFQTTNDTGTHTRSVSKHLLRKTFHFSHVSGLIYSTRCSHFSAIAQTKFLEKIGLYTFSLVCGFSRMLFL